MNNENLITHLYEWISNIQKIENRKMRLGDSGEYFPSDIRLMKAVNQYPNLNITEISEVLNVTKGTLSKLVNKLTNQECLEKFKKEDNKKNVYVRLTSLGKSVLDDFDAFRKHHKVNLDAELNQFSQDELIAIDKFLCVINKKVF